MKPVCRAALAVALVLAFGPSFAAAQDPRLVPPNSPAEFWAALEFELNTGQFEAAAAYLRGFLAANPTDQDFIAIDRGPGGFNSFLRLRNVLKWSADPKVEA